MYLSVTSDYLVMLVQECLAMLLMAFIIVSIILFVLDGIKAQKEKRKRKTWITVLFVIGMIFSAILVIVMIAFFALLFFGFAVYAFFPR